MLVNLANPLEVAGVQFEVSNIIINSASGGTSADNGFLISTSNTSPVVLGFSLEGNVIPPGEAVFLELDYTATWNESCISEIVVSDAVGEMISANFVGGCQALDYTVTEGCMDPDACNYNVDANSDDGSCVYPEENFDCDGNCAVEVDCAGVCGGDAVIDGCGECGGDESTCTGCMDDTALNYDSEATIACDDCCEYPTQVNISVSNVSSDGVVEVNMSNISAVAGFQFEFASTCEVSINSGYGGSADASVVDVAISGNSNTFDIDWGYAASSERLNFDLDITGGSNVWDINIDADDVTWDVDVIGSSNNFATTQADGAYQSLTLEWIGSNGDIDILQTSGTCGSGISGCYGVINADFDSENAVVNIKQKDTGD